MSDPASQALATPPTLFVGREELISQAEGLVREQRLVTLVGPGGIGKTRLASELAEAVGPEFPGGVIAVPLDAVMDPDDVAWRAASAVLAVDQSTQDPYAQVVHQLGDRRVLLVVDNCEHLLEATAELLMRVLRECPGVHVLATSIEPLDITGEWVLLVPPLQVPDSCADLAAVRESEAVRLLVDRAAQAGVDLVVDEDNCEDTIQLCERLDGMPLAIELAAARLRSLSIGDLLDRLDFRFSLLRGSGRDVLPRHRTLQALVDWTYQLCTPEEQLLWSRLSVFRGTCDLDAAERVCGFGAIDPSEVLDLLDGLVSKSVVIARTVDGRASFRQLVTMRDYGARVAQQSGEWEELRRRHADLVLTRSREMHTGWVGSEQANWLRRARHDQADIVAAMDWGIATPEKHDVAAEIAANLRYYWASGNNMSIGRYRLERVLALPDVAPSLRCECLLVFSWVALLQGDHSDALHALEEARALATELDDWRRLAEVETWTGLWLLFSGDPGEGVEHYRRGMAVLREVGDLAAWLTAGFQLALCQIYSGDTAGAEATSDELLRECRRAQEIWVQAYALWTSAIVKWRQGDLPGAKDQAAAALRFQLVFRDGIATPHILGLVARIVLATGDARRAARVQGAAEALWAAQGTGFDAFGPGLSGDAGETRERVLRMLGPAEAEAVMAEMTDIELGAAVEMALSELESLEIAAPSGVKLTKREAQVAELLADGLSNKQIAGRLTISIRTVDGHVERILSKFGATSRAQVAVRLREAGAGQVAQ